jgi:hypothetical protein
MAGGTGLSRPKRKLSDRLRRLILSQDSCTGDQGVTQSAVVQPRYSVSWRCTTCLKTLIAAASSI